MRSGVSCAGLARFPRQRPRRRRSAPAPKAPRPEYAPWSPRLARRPKPTPGASARHDRSSNWACVLNPRCSAPKRLRGRLCEHRARKPPAAPARTAEMGLRAASKKSPTSKRAFFGMQVFCHREMSQLAPILATVSKGTPAVCRTRATFAMSRLMRLVARRSHGLPPASSPATPCQSRERRQHRRGLRSRTYPQV